MPKVLPQRVGGTRAVTERQTPGDTQPEFSLTIYLRVFFITIYLRKANSLYPLLLVLTYFPGDTRPEFSLTIYLRVFLSPFICVRPIPCILYCLF